MRVAFYGGSFNPPHVGHAMVAAWLLWTDQVDEVWIVPVGTHAFGKGLAPFARRRAWCEALARSLGDRVRVEPIEDSLPPPSYTIRTLEALSQRHPGAHFRLVIGADSLPGLSRWHRTEELQERFPLLVAGRAGYPSPPGVPVFPGVSSTQIRERLVAEESVRDLVPAGVLAGITQDDRDAWRTSPGA